MNVRSTFLILRNGKTFDKIDPRTLAKRKKKKAKTFDKIANSATRIQQFSFLFCFFENQIRLIHKDDLLEQHNLSQQQVAAKENKYSKSRCY